MRNWKSYGNNLSREWKSRWEPTYEELKDRWEIILEENYRRLRAYLWGIESQVVGMNVRLWLSLRAYLWGIERWSQFLYPQNLVVGWEPTYEELKAVYCLFTFSFLWLCWEPTYEELKAMWFYELAKYIHMLRAYLWGIERKMMYGCKWLRCLLRAYLWGIESLFKLKYPHISYLVESLPMRNWKQNVGTTAGMNFWVESLPMRNWKHLSQNLIWSFAFVESLPMRNWKLLRLHLWRSNHIWLRAYLWGIESFIFCQFCDFLRVSWEPTYEELKGL